VGWQVTPAVQGTQLPNLQTEFVPHGVPSVTAMLLSLQTGLPLMQLSVPV